jgi:glycosyltransferase involved in cell wall biosynthesis
VRAVVHTRLLRRALVDAGIPAASIKLIPCGSPPPVEQMDADEAKAALGYGPTDRVLVIFGFVSGYKGHRVAVEALRSLPAEYHLAIVGGPNPQVNDLAFDEVLQKSRRPRLAERVRVTGYVPFSDMRLYSSAADIVLAPYVTADLASSAAITWAMASGHPVIASRIPAFQELNEGVPRMVLATPRAPSELAHRILQLDQDEALKAELVKNALAYVTEHSWRTPPCELNCGGLRGVRPQWCSSKWSRETSALRGQMSSMPSSSVLTEACPLALSTRTGRLMSL